MAAAQQFNLLSCPPQNRNTTCCASRAYSRFDKITSGADRLAGHPDWQRDSLIAAENRARSILRDPGATDVDRQIASDQLCCYRELLAAADHFTKAQR